MDPQQLPVSIFTWFIFIIYFIALGCSIYAFILFVKLARRGVKALDIYIDEKSNVGPKD